MRYGARQHKEVNEMDQDTKMDIKDMSQSMQSIANSLSQVNDSLRIIRQLLGDKNK